MSAVEPLGLHHSLSKDRPLGQHFPPIQPPIPLGPSPAVLAQTFPVLQLSLEVMARSVQEPAALPPTTAELERYPVSPEPPSPAASPALPVLQPHWETSPPNAPAVTDGLAPDPSGMPASEVAETPAIAPASEANHPLPAATLPASSTPVSDTEAIVEPTLQRVVEPEISRPRETLPSETVTSEGDETEVADSIQPAGSLVQRSPEPDSPVRSDSDDSPVQSEEVEPAVQRSAEEPASLTIPTGTGLPLQAAADAIDLVAEPAVQTETGLIVEQPLTQESQTSDSAPLQREVLNRLEFPLSPTPEPVAAQESLSQSTAIQPHPVEPPFQGVASPTPVPRPEVQLPDHSGTIHLQAAPETESLTLPLVEARGIESATPTSEIAAPIEQATGDASAQPIAEVDQSTSGETALPVTEAVQRSPQSTISPAPIETAEWEGMAAPNEQPAVEPTRQSFPDPGTPVTEGTPPRIADSPVQPATNSIQRTTAPGSETTSATPEVSELLPDEQAASQPTSGVQSAAVEPPAANPAIASPAVQSPLPGDVSDSVPVLAEPDRPSETLAPAATVSTDAPLATVPPIQTFTDPALPTAGAVDGDNPTVEAVQPPFTAAASPAGVPEPIAPHITPEFEVLSPPDVLSLSPDGTETDRLQPQVEAAASPGGGTPASTAESPNRHAPQPDALPTWEDAAAFLEEMAQHQVQRSPDGEEPFTPEIQQSEPADEVISRTPQLLEPPAPPAEPEAPPAAPSSSPPPTKEDVTEEQLDALARQIYSLLRQQWVIHQERHGLLGQGRLAWLGTIPPPVATAIQGNAGGSAGQEANSHAMLFPPDAKLTQLTHEVQVLLQIQMEVDRERQGCFSIQGRN